MTLAKLSLWLLVVLAGAWIWRGHGIREKAFIAASQTCTNQGLQLLDQNVAFAGWGRIKDRNGHTRLVRKYRFEFTVTAEERLNGWVYMHRHFAMHTQLDPHPYPHATQNSSPAYTQDKVTDLAQWKTDHTTRKH